MKIALSAGSVDKDHYAIAAAMAAAMAHSDDAEVRIESFDGGALGCTITGDRHSRVPLFIRAPEGNRLAVSGVPIAARGALAELLAATAEQDSHTATRTLSRLDGAFAALHWDAAARTFSVVTDFLGVQPLYLYRSDGLLLVASELQGIAASGVVDIAMEPAGWGTFFCFGHTLGNSTQLADVQRAAPASILRYTPATDRLETETHWRLDEMAPCRSARNIDTEAVRDLLLRDINAYREHYAGGTLFFSGGYDSRLLLALLKEAQIDVDLVVVEHAGHFLGMEAKLAKRAARHMGAKDCQIVQPSDDFYNSADFLRYLAMNEVASPALSLFIAKVAQYVQPEMKAIWQGVGPGHIIRPPVGPPGGIDRYFRCASIADDNPAWRAAETVFAAPLVQAMKDTVSEEVSRLRKRYTNDGNGVWRFTVEHRMRNRTSPNPTQVYANYILPFTPAFNHELWELIAGIDQETLRSSRLARRGDELARRLLLNHFPAAAAVPFCTEEKVYAFQGVHPELWFTNLCGTAQYYMRRLGIQSAVRRLAPRRARPPARQATAPPLVQLVLASVDPDDLELNADGVRAVLCDLRGDVVARLARRMLFYRQTWRWTMGGTLRAQHADGFLEDLRAPRGRLVESILS